MKTFETRSIKGTLGLGRKFAGRLDVGDCVALVGELGSGKTVLARGLAEGLGIRDSRMVASPTFVLVREYVGRLPIFHVDLYRTVRPAAELAALGIEEMLAQGLVVIEWADRAGEALPHPHWQIVIEITGQTSRRFRLTRID